MLNAKSFAAVTLFLYFVLLSRICYASNKSVFIISAQNPGRVQAYMIDANQVKLQAELTLPYETDHGPIALAAWPVKNIMFATYGESPMISWVSTKTLAKLGEIAVGGVGSNGLSGIVVDSKTSKIYVAERTTNNLRVFQWNSATQTIVPDNNHILSGITTGTYRGIFGLALDEPNNLIYASDGGTTVRRYDITNTALNWSVQGSITLNRNAVAIAVDPNRNCIYSGDYPDGEGDAHLVRSTTTSPHSYVETSLSGEYQPVFIGIDVDRASGLVYCTTGNSAGLSGGPGDFRVYAYNAGSNTLTQQAIAPDIGSSEDGPGPAGVAVGGFFGVPPEPNVWNTNRGLRYSSISAALKILPIISTGTLIRWWYIPATTLKALKSATR
jgi:hypothetical protein